MTKRTMKERVAERFKRRQEDKRERERIRYGKDYEPEHPDWR